MKGSDLDFLRKVIKEIERFELINDVELTTAHYPLLVNAKRLNPRIRIGTFFYQPPDWMPVSLVQKQTLDWAELLDIDVVHLNLSLITKEFTDKLHDHGFIVYGSNLDSSETIRRGLELGVDSFSTSHLKLALHLRDEFVALT